MSAERNKEVVRRAMSLANSRDPDAAGECMAADVRRNGAPTDRDAERMRDEFLGSAFPDLEYTEQDMVAEGDRVALRWRMTGTHTGELAGPTMTLPPFGRRLDIVDTSFYRLQDGLIHEVWETLDLMDFRRQLGALDAPAAAPD